MPQPTPLPRHEFPENSRLRKQKPLLELSQISEGLAFP